MRVLPFREVERGGAQGISVSVVVPVRNGGSELADLVAALERQSVSADRFEVLIGDDGSTDGATDRVATGNGSVRVIPGPPENPYRARNRAAAEARGAVLAFCDVDCRPDPDWLERGLAAVEAADVVAGLVRFSLPGRRTPWSLVDMETFLDQERTVRNGRAVTANLFVRRDLFDRVGGFEDSLPNGGDQEFVARCVRGGARLTFAPEVVVLHPPRDTARAFLGKVWRVNRVHAKRELREGRRPSAYGIRAWLPVISVMRSRHRSGRSLRLDRRRLADSGIRPTWRDDLLALPVIYLVVPYLGAVAQLIGSHGAKGESPDLSGRA